MDGKGSRCGPGALPGPVAGGFGEPFSGSAVEPHTPRIDAMKPLAAALAVLALAGLQAARAEPAAVPGSVAPPSGGTGRASEPNVRHTVIEDDGARIDELRVRGETQSISVSPKRGGARYEIVTPTGGRDLGTGPTTPRGAVGQRVWRVLQF